MDSLKGYKNKLYEMKKTGWNISMTNDDHNIIVLSYDPPPHC
jgi:hypothetical protein